VSSLSTVRPAALVSQQAADMLQTACHLLTAALDGDVIAESSTQTLLNQFIETTMRRREAECHEAVTRVFGRLSELRACGPEVIKWVQRSGKQQAMPCADGQTCGGSQVDAGGSEAERGAGSGCDTV
jgi:hypothetical protein